METKKVLGIIFSILFIGAFAFVLSWGIINFNKVQDGLSGTGVYTKEDVDNAYKDGYSTALDNEKEYTELIDSYRDTITSLTDQISQFNSQIIILTNNNKDYVNQIANLESQKTSLQEQIENLTTINNNNEFVISQLNTQIAELEKEILELENNSAQKDNIITQKTAQIENLQLSISELQRTNDLNLSTIQSLNNQISYLNGQIGDYFVANQDNSLRIITLTNRIKELENSISYYENYISSLENNEQSVVTFEFNGSIYNIQIVNNGSTVSVSEPISTDYVIFNYWTVNGEQIDLSTYQITSNVKIVADVTRKYEIKFMVDDSVYATQIVAENERAAYLSSPKKDGYAFVGWTLNGVEVDPFWSLVTDNVTYVASFAEKHTVNFMYNNKLLISEPYEVVDNCYLDTRTNPSPSLNTLYIVLRPDENTEIVLNGWKLNGVFVDPYNVLITSDTIFEADITFVNSES